VERSAVEKIEGLERAIRCKNFARIRTGGKGKRRAARMTLGDVMGDRGR